MTLPDAVEQAIVGWIEWGRSVPDPLEQIEAVACLGDEALLRFADAIMDGPLDEAKLEVCYRLGYALHERGLIEGARRRFEQVAAAQPGYQQVDDWLAAIGPQPAPSEPSLPDMSAFADDEIDGTELENARLAGLQAMVAGQPCTPTNVAVHYMYAVELMARRHWTEAGEVLRTIERVSPGYGDVAVRLVEVECNTDADADADAAPAPAPAAGGGTGTLYGLVTPNIGTGTLYGMMAPPVPRAAPPPAPAPPAPAPPAPPRPEPAPRITPAQPRSTVYGFAPTLPTSGDDDHHERRKTPAMNFAVSNDIQGIYRLSRGGTRPPVAREEFAPKPKREPQPTRGRKPRR